MGGHQELPARTGLAQSEREQAQHVGVEAVIDFFDARQQGRLRVMNDREHAQGPDSAPGRVCQAGASSQALLLQFHLNLA
ncbi:hypothetical protein GCM10023238_11630 [Streptomyces heliomycini]